MLLLQMPVEIYGWTSPTQKWATQHVIFNKLWYAPWNHKWKLVPKFSPGSSVTLEDTGPTNENHHPDKCPNSWSNYIWKGTKIIIYDGGDTTLNVIHCLIWGCSSNSGLWNASRKNQTALMVHKNGKKANPAKNRKT